MISNNLPELEEKIQTVSTENAHELMVFNDEINTFEHVIDTLMDICEHSAEQAEQCTLIIHNNGKCTVNNGSFDSLASQRDAICKRGINAEIL